MIINVSNLRIVTAAAFLLSLPAQNNLFNRTTASNNPPIYASPEAGPWPQNLPENRLNTVKSEEGTVTKEVLIDRIDYIEKDRSLFGHPKRISFSPRDFSVPSFIVTAVPGALNEAAGACERHHFPVLHMHEMGNLVLCSATGSRPDWVELTKLVEEPDVAEVTPNQEMTVIPEITADSLATLQ